MRLKIVWLAVLLAAAFPAFAQVSVELVLNQEKYNTTISLFFKLD